MSELKIIKIMVYAIAAITAAVATSMLHRHNPAEDWLVILFLILVVVYLVKAIANEEAI
jgi:uncharacterized membrane protein YfhO